MADSSDEQSSEDASKDGTSGNSSSDESVKNVVISPKKVQRSASTMIVEETDKELKYRKKHFSDPDEVATSLKLRCTSCNTSLQSHVLEGRDVYHHPVLKVLICKKCLDFYGDGNFSPDEDGLDKYCRWCGQGGMLYCCQACCCVFCKKCIKRNLSRSILVDIESEDWKCFVCDGKPLWELRAICRNAQILSRNIKRRRKNEIEQNLKQLQKKKPLTAKLKRERGNRWQKRFEHKSSTDDEDSATDNSDSEKNKSKKSTSRNRNKRSKSSSSSDSAKNKKKDPDVIIMDSSEEEKEVIGKKLPNNVDLEDAEEAATILTEYIEDIATTGQLMVTRAEGLLKKKVNKEELIDTSKFIKVADRVKLLAELASDNLKHIVGILDSRKEKWCRDVRVKCKRKSKVNIENKQLKTDKDKKSNENGDITSEIEADKINGADVTIDKLNESENNIDDGNDLCEKSIDTSDGVEVEPDNDITRSAVKRKPECDDVQLPNKKLRVQDHTNEVPDDEQDESIHQLDTQEYAADVSVKSILDHTNELPDGEPDESIHQLDTQEYTADVGVKSEPDSDIHQLDTQQYNDDVSVNEGNKKPKSSPSSINSLSTIHLNKSQDMFEDTLQEKTRSDDENSNTATIEFLNNEETVDDLNMEKNKDVEENPHDPLAVDSVIGKTDKNEECKKTIDPDSKECAENKESEEHVNIPLKPDIEVSERKEVSEGKDAINEDTLKVDYSEDCLEAQKALLVYTSDDEDDDKSKSKEKKKNKKKQKQKVDSHGEEGVRTDNLKKKKKIGPKSRRSSSLSSSSSSDIETGSSSSCKLEPQKSGNEKKHKLRLKDTAEYKQDEKLRWRCTVAVEKLPEEEFKKYYEEYCSSGKDDLEEEEKAKKDIKSLVNLKNLEKGKGKTSKSLESESDSDDNQRNQRVRRMRAKKKEDEETLIDFFNKEDEDDDEPISNGDQLSHSGSELDIDKSKSLKKKSIVEKENEMALKLLLRSSSEDGDVGDNEEEEGSLPESKAEKKDEKLVDEDECGMIEKDEKNVEKAEQSENDEKNVEEKEQSVGQDDENEHDESKKEEQAEQNAGKEEENECDEKEKKEKESIEGDNKSDGSSCDDSQTPKKKNWRKDRLLTEKLSDLDTSDEERLWKARKERLRIAENESDDSTRIKKKKRKNNVKHKLLDSEEEEECKVSSSSSDSESKASDSSDMFVKKKRKKKRSKSSDSDSSDVASSKKTKRRRIKAPASDSSSNEDDEGPSQKSESQGKGRKKIHHILADDDVAEATRKAAKEEAERKKRIAEKQKLYNEMYNVIAGVERLDKLVLDFDPETKKELVAVHPSLVTKLKPHQAQGVKFMWDACFESIKRIKSSKGTGCILAHCMGLGKTFQIVTLVHTLLNNKDTGVRTVLVVCPLSTVLNWVSEFNMWLKGGEEVNVFELTRYKQNYERLYRLKDWQEEGGVLVIGYDMYRNLTNLQAKRLKKKAIETFQSTLVDPGPDLVVCDEGHLLKNEDSLISKAMRRIKTLRRIVLTGTPLQNNLREYHCMVQFVKPNLLGNRKEFLNRFVNPITNGQFEDSTAHDVKIMKRRAHVLHKMLEGSVQRFDYSVLTPFLPPKQEYVISIRLSDVQIKAYRYYLDNYSRNNENKGAQLFSDFNNLQRIWTHPRVLQMKSDQEEKKNERELLTESDSEGSLKDFICDETSGSSTTTEESSNEDSDVQVVDGEEGGKKKNKPNKFVRTTRSKGPADEPEILELPKEGQKESTQTWWKQFIQEDELENIKYSGKLVLLFDILEECEKIGDKVLVFSQSLFSLDLIEYFLAKIDSDTQKDESSGDTDKHTGSWARGLDYFRLDGSSSNENRNAWCKAFNHEDNHRARLFLISTRAGGLGINLFGANRAIIFDASWNPSHDVQSIFRIYRFGQKKPCYIYRFLAQGTMEEKIYDRQVTKLSLSCRVVDEQQIERHYNMADLQELYQFDPEQKTKRPTPILPKDRLLAELLKQQEYWIVTYHEHDSLLENKQEEELNEEEREAAWEEYENEKKGKVNTVVGGPMQGINYQAIRDAMRKEDPTATEEQLEQKMVVVMGQIFDYMNTQQANVNTQKYTAAQKQAYHVYQFQQQLRAKVEKQMMMQQQQQDPNLIKAAASTVAGYVPNTNSTLQQYLQEQKVAYSAYPTNLYRNTSMDKSGVFRIQPKLVSINPNAIGAAGATGKKYSHSIPASNSTLFPQPASANRNQDANTRKDGDVIETIEDID